MPQIISNVKDDLELNYSIFLELYCETGSGQSVLLSNASEPILAAVLGPQAYPNRSVLT